MNFLLICGELLHLMTNLAWWQLWEKWMRYFDLFGRFTCLANGLYNLFTLRLLSIFCIYCIYFLSPLLVVSLVDLLSWTWLNFLVSYLFIYSSHKIFSPKLPYFSIYSLFVYIVPSNIICYDDIWLSTSLDCVPFYLGYFSLLFSNGNFNEL